MATTSQRTPSPNSRKSLAPQSSMELSGPSTVKCVPNLVSVMELLLSDYRKVTGEPTFRPVLSTSAQPHTELVLALDHIVLKGTEVHVVLSVKMVTVRLV